MLIRTIAKVDLDLLFETYGFDCDFGSYIGKGLVVEDAFKLKAVLCFTKHNIQYFKISEELPDDWVTRFFERMYARNRQNKYYCKVGEYDLREQLILKKLGYTCHKVDKDCYRFYIESPCS